MKLASLVAVLTTLASAQEPAFRSETNVVLVPVVVRDSSGKSVGGLGRDDFRLLEDGQPRTITNIELEVRDVRSTIPNQFDVYIFDDLHLSFQDMEHARKSFEKHLTDTTTASRRIAVLTTSSTVATTFTESRETLLETVRRIRPRADMQSGSECPEISYYLAELIAKHRDRTALGIVTGRVIACMKGILPHAARQVAEAEAARTMRVEGDRTKAALAVLMGAVERLQKSPGSRSVILVSSGFHLGDDKERQGLSRILTNASQHRVTVSAVNAYGVRRTGVDATMRDAADWLRNAAEETGGMYIGNSNDVEAGLRRIAEPPEHTYVLAFSPGAARKPGAFHKLEVKLSRGQGLSVQARRGYYESAPISAAEHLRTLLFSNSEIQQLALSFEVESLQPGKPRVTAAIDLNGLPFRSGDAKHRNSVVVGFGLFDVNGRLVSQRMRQADMNLDEASLTRLRENGLRLSADLDAAAGTYVLRIVARESENGRIATVSRTVTLE
jgi:VWFA-related protein